MAECLKLADEIAGAAFLVDTSFVEVRAEVDETNVLVCEQVPHDNEHRAGDGDKGALVSPPSDESAIALAQERIGPRSRRRGLAKGSLQVRVALSRLTRTGRWAGLNRAGSELRPRIKVHGAQELGHVEADLGEDDLGSTWADAGDLVQPLHSAEASQITVAVVAVRFGNLLDELFDTGSQPIDLLTEHVDLIEEHACEFGMVRT